MDVKVVPVEKRGGKGSKEVSAKMLRRNAQRKHKARDVNGVAKAKQSVANRTERYNIQREVNKNLKLK